MSARNAQQARTGNGGSEALAHPERDDLVGVTVLQGTQSLRLDAHGPIAATAAAE